MDEDRRGSSSSSSRSRSFRPSVETLAMGDPIALNSATATDDPFESILLLPGSKLVPSGIKAGYCEGDPIVFVNAGGGTMEGRRGPAAARFEGDSHYRGGDVISSEEQIVDGGDYPSLYQSARYGDFCYLFADLERGDYLVDLHFSEIAYTNGPKGIRVFNVFLQEDKILSELDIYAVVGANNPLQVVDLRVCLDERGDLSIRFEGVNGPPIVCGICIRKAPKLPCAQIMQGDDICNTCGSNILRSPTQNRAQPPLPKLTARYEKKIEELMGEYRVKNDECHEAWMLLSEANEQKERLRMELDNKFFQTGTLERTVEKQEKDLKALCDKYGHEKKLWDTSIRDLEVKVKDIKQEHRELSHEAHECAKTIPDLNKMLAGVESMVSQCEDLKAKYSEELARSKRLHNEVQEMRGNIRVFCRCRPLSKEEVLSGNSSAADFEGAKDGDISIITGASTKKTYRFDKVYTPRDGQVDVYADASAFVTSVLDGYNVCILAYGQTGTGKTFTMEGTEQNRGVNYRTLEELFKIAGERKETVSYSISVSVLEVYNEQIRDLLATSRCLKKLEVKQAAEGVHHVPGIVEAKVENIKEVWDVLQMGSNARAVGSNNVNEHSSRSHCMLCIMVRAKNLMNGECTRSKLWLVDLAGSERLAKTDVQGERLKEAQNINRSLSALGDVISALANKSNHIPYRNSKLTHILQDSLGGDSKAVMFVQISPSEADIGETLSSLNFASRVRGIELGQAKKQIDSGELQKMKQMVEKLRQESKIKEETTRNLKENYQNLENKIKGKDQLCKTLQEKNKELEGQLESRAGSQSLSEMQNLQLLERLKGKEEMCTALQQKIKELDKKMGVQHDSEQKIKELEQKLKEQLESQIVAANKAEELERKIKEKQITVSALEQKVMQLESQMIEGVGAELRASSPSKGEEESAREEASERRVLKFLNSAASKEADPPLLHHQDLRGKNGRRSGGGGAEEAENLAGAPAISTRRGSLASEGNKPRKMETFERLARATRPASASCRKPLPHGGGGGKLASTKDRFWSR